MIKSALFTLGVIVALGGFGWAFVTLIGASMSDSVQASNEAAGDAGTWAVVGVFGVLTCVAAYMLK